MNRALGRLLALILFAIPAHAVTVTGNIADSVTWSPQNNPYVLSGLVTVGGPNSPVLTIEAGTRVYGTIGSALLINGINNGSIVVQGDPSDPVKFSSWGGATPGHWHGLQFNGPANAPQSRITWAVVEFAGWNSGQENGGITVFSSAEGALQPIFDHVTIRKSLFGLVVHGGTVTLKNSTVDSNDGDAVRVLNPSTLTLSGNALTNNLGYAVSLAPSTIFTTPTVNTATGNGTLGNPRNAIEIRAGSLFRNLTWPLTGMPYVVTGTVDIGATTGATLTVVPGNTVRFSNGAQLSVNQVAKGALYAAGTSTAPIVFTSNGVEAEGAWLGLRFGPAAGAPQSNLTWATVEYAGSTSSSRGGISIESNPVTLDHLSVHHHQFAGVSLHNGSMTLTSSSISSNRGSGINVIAGTTLALSGNTFQNNDAYAATLPVTVSVTAPGGLNSATTNGGGNGNSIEYRAGTITTDMTWAATGIGYAVSGTIDVMSANAPTLTIAANNTIRFNNGAQLSCNQSSKGALRAIGTAAEPITFTSNGNPIPGAWLGLTFGPAANPPQSSVAFATIEYGGSNSVRGGITVNGASPQFDHLTLRNNLYAGMVVNTNSTPQVTNSHFADNPRGIHTTGTGTVQATLNYWNSVSGACQPTACAGGQQSVTAAVTFEPWLIASPSSSNYLLSANHRNDSFNPAIGTSTWVDYTTLPRRSTVTTIRNAANTVVRTLPLSGTPATIQWDGKNDSGVIQPDGTYQYDIELTTAPTTIARGSTVVDSTRTLQVGNPTWSRAYFSPNGDSVQDRTVLTSSTNYDDAAWTITIRHAEYNYVVHTVSGTGPVISFDWDGIDNPDPHPDGLYEAKVQATVGTALAVKYGMTTLDNTPPVSSIASPTANAMLSNIYANGSLLAPISGSALDFNLQSWNTSVGTGASPTSWSSVGSGTTSGTGPLGSWNTTGWQNGPYTIRLVASDKAGNSSTTTVPVNLGHFTSSQNAYQFNAATGGSLTYTSAVPFPVTESIVIRNLQGTVVRTLVNASRPAGTYQDVFNGRTQAGALLPDGAYFYSVQLTAGTHTFTWDQSNVMRDYEFEVDDELAITPYDPFDNRPLTFTYNFDRAARITVAMSTLDGHIHGDCAQPSNTFFCGAADVWQEAGEQTFTWWGVDESGTYRWIRNVGIASSTEKFPKNAAVLFGTKPRVANVRVTPRVYGPEFSKQLIEADVATYQNQPVTLTVDVTNLETRSTLRVVNVPNQPPGHAAFSWDGRAYNGKWLAPGAYSVVVTATDPIGNAVRSGILTTIKY